MEEHNSETCQAAEVVMLIVQNEGKIEQGPEDPSEFQPAYELLLSLKIIKEQEGEFLPGPNFEKAAKIGLKEFLRKMQLREQQPRNRNKWIAGITGGALLAAVGYLLRPGRN